MQLEKNMPRTGHSERIERRAQEIVDSLGGTWRGKRGMCRCPAHDDRTPSLSVSLGRRAILFHCFAGCPNEKIIAELGRLGIRAPDLFNGSADPLPERVIEEAADRNACRLWQAAASLPDSAAARYLSNRGIRLSSPELRFHGRTPLGPREAVRFLPAMLAAVRTDVGVIAAHRTFLDPEMTRLAPMESPKRALGSLGRGAVRLSWPAEGKLGLAEGVESALSAMQLFGIPCWATLGNERFGLVAIPQSVSELHLFIDHDPGGDLAEERARDAYAVEGRRILTRRPARPGADWNDQLVERQRAEVGA